LKLCTSINTKKGQHISGQDRMPWHYFELKTDNAKQSIRKALGQILEYAFFPNANKAEKLIIVSDEKPSEDVIKYLNHIRNLFDLPIVYKYFNLEENELSDDY